MQDGEGWYWRAVNVGLEPAAQLNVFIMFIMFICKFVFILCYNRLLLLFTRHLKKKNFSAVLRLWYVTMHVTYVCYCNGLRKAGRYRDWYQSGSLLPIHSLPAIATIIVSYSSVLFLLLRFNYYALMY